MTHRLLVLLSILVMAMALAACNGDQTAEVATPTSEPTPTETDEPTPTPTSTGPADDPTDPTDDVEPDDTELPGEAIDLFPNEGAELAVVGVEADDTLNVRSGPGVDFDVVLELDPLAEGAIATGHNRQLDSGAIWAEITAEGTTGWANTAFLSHLGTTDDVTSQLFPSPADRPTAETMLELGQLVAEQVASDEPPSTITVVDGPTVGDLGEVTVDVIGLGDDSVGGLRLHVFAEPDPGGESFTVRTVEQTTLCSRGVTDGLCL